MFLGYYSHECGLSEEGAKTLFTSLQFTHMDHDENKKEITLYNVTKAKKKPLPIFCLIIGEGSFLGCDLTGTTKDSMSLTYTEREEVDPIFKQFLVDTEGKPNA